MNVGSRKGQLENHRFVLLFAVFQARGPFCKNCVITVFMYSCWLLFHQNPAVEKTVHIGSMLASFWLQFGIIIGAWRLPKSLLGVVLPILFGIEKTAVKLPCGSCESCESWGGGPLRVILSGDLGTRGP